MMRCHRCETEVPADATFCDGCGERLETPCPTCHALNRPSARFCKACGVRLTSEGPAPSPRFAAPQTYTPPHLAERILTSRSAIEGERKQVTVLFADVEDFTGLGAALDPESLHELMDRVFATLLDVIHRYEGTVNQFTGDGVMALFGAPVALEDHALRAVQAALEVQRVMRATADEFRRRWGRAPALRIGLNTGRVVVGKIGDDLRMDYTAQGDTVNLAARVQSIAAGGTVAISEATYRLVADRVAGTPLGAHHVKGREAPVDVYRPEHLVEESTDRVAAHAVGAFVDREAELATLLDLYEDVRAGRARTAIVTGEAGVGKSRLVQELRQRVEEPSPRWFEGRCAPYDRNTPYRPLVEIVRRMCGLEDNDSEAVARQKLEHLLGGLGEEGRQIGPALAYVLTLGPGDTEMALLSPSERKASITLALDRLIQRSARAHPHVFVVKDCQWIDPASAEYLTRVSSEMTRGMILFILTSRPAESGRARFEPTGTHIGLRPLSPSQSQKLIRLLAAPLLEDMVALVVDRTGGNPLFIEEVTRTIRENEAVEIPPTVADLLAARIDRLPGPAKAVLQVASVIGREFPRRQLERVVDDVTGIDSVLDLLRDMGLIAQSTGADGSYVFRQGLLQETAYEGLLLQRRKLLHQRVGEVLEELYADRLFEHVDTLARHFLRAEDWGRAAFYLREAGRKAAALCANSEATQRFLRALEVVGRMPETLERSRLATDIRLDLRAPLLQLGRLDDLLRVSREAEELAQMLGDERRLARVYAYMINYHYLKGEPDQAIEYGRRCLEIGDRVDSGVERSARQYLATSYHALGRYAMAVDMLGRNIADLERRDEWTRAGPENLIYITSCGWLGWAHVETGDFANAHTWADKAVVAAEGAGNAYALAIAQSMAALVQLHQGHLDRAVPLLETALGLCREHHLIVWEPIPSSLLGLALTLHGDIGRGLELLRAAVAQTEKLGVNAYRSRWETHLADGLLVAGQAHLAVDVARAAVELAVRCKEAGNHATALLVLGEAYRRSGDTGFARADETIRQALVEGEELRMRPLTAHCYLALSRLAAAQGDRARQMEYLTTAREQARGIDLRFWSDAADVDPAGGARVGQPDELR